ncbi:DUF2304 domain-containing protein [Methanobacterium aggregans]
MIYQILGILVGLFAVIITILRFRDGKMSLGMMALWNLIWLLLILISIYPASTSIFAKVTGIGRGLDLILILGLIMSFYLIFKLYSRLETVEEELTDLVREIAIQNEYSNPDSKESSKTHKLPKKEN